MSHGADLSDHTFIVSSLLTGQVISEVDISSFNYVEVLNRPGAGEATARMEADTTNEENFLPWGNALWCLEGGEILWGGIIGGIQPRAGSRVINVPLHGFMEYYRSQPIQTTVPPEYTVTSPPNSQWDYGLSYGGHPHKSAIVFQDVDQFNIFEDLINHVAKRDALSDIHPNVIYEQLSGVTRDETWYNYDYKMVGVACEQLADRENGFFWTTRFGFDIDGPTFTFYLNHNLNGVDRPITLEWDDTPEETNLMEYDFSGYTRPGNSVIGIGEGQGPASIVARKESTASPTGAFTGGRPRYYEVVSFRDVVKQTTLQAHVNKHWQRHAVPYRSATVTMNNPEAEFMAFDLGDTVNLKVIDDALNVLQKYRAVRRAVVLTKESDKVVTLDLEEPFAYLES